MYKGTIIENSLSDKSILNKIQIIKTYQLDDWILYDVIVDEKQIDEFGKYLLDGPWYIHFWKDKLDDFKVVFKKKTFSLKHSDKTTWSDATKYGKSIGIPEEQLDFAIV